MLRYYDERASEYEEAYLLGTGTASIPDPSVFQTDARKLGEIVERGIDGRVIDIACGTGFWLPRYAPRASTITLIDQSTNMLDECRKQVTALGIDDRVSYIQGDVLEHECAAHTFDAALVGFLISHLSGAEEDRIFGALRNLLGPTGRVLILDSAWTDERARVNRKVEHQRRTLNDGTPFIVYKRYFDRNDIRRWEERHRLKVSVEYFGVGLFAASGRFGSGST